MANLEDGAALHLQNLGHRRDVQDTVVPAFSSGTVCHVSYWRDDSHRAEPSGRTQTATVMQTVKRSGVNSCYIILNERERVPKASERCGNSVLYYPNMPRHHTQHNPQTKTQGNSLFCQTEPGEMHG